MDSKLTLAIQATLFGGSNGRSVLAANALIRGPEGGIPLRLRLDQLGRCLRCCRRSRRPRDCCWC